MTALLFVLAQSFLERHCVECHGAEKPKGHLRLDTYRVESPDDASVATGVRILERIRAGEMPPKKAPAPPAAEREAFLADFDARLQAADRARLRSPVRRLNRIEFEHSLRDLLALPTLRVKEGLPEDGRRHHFDKVAGALDVSHIQMLKILDAADAALRLAASPPPERPETKIWREPVSQQDSGRLAIRTLNALPLNGAEFAAGYGTKVEGDPVKDPANSYRVGTFKGEAETLLIMSGGLGAHQPDGIQPDRFRPKSSGWYRLKFSARGVRWDKTKIVAADLLHVLRVSLKGKLLGFYDIPAEPVVHELKIWLDPGQCPSFHAMTLPGHAVANSPSKNGASDYEGPGIAMDWFEIEGPLVDAWPPESRERLFGDGRLRAFAERAFRRPVADAELQRYAALAKPGGLEAFRAILCSPDFLFTGLEGGAYTLASRLSYFLWDSLPDEELLARAKAGDLGEPAVLRAQVERLLRDPRSQRFVEHFLDEWLDLHNLDFTTPDRQLYPDYDPWLRESMPAETRAWFRRLLDGNLPVTQLVASDVVLVDQRLARLYEIPGVSGSSLREVPVPPGSLRGGFLTQASVLKVTANGTATSPILRGVWIGERLLGIPRLPPPPNIPAVEPDARGATTIRQLIEKHRADPACAYCHARMDPPGLALESFDVIGARREWYRIAGSSAKKPGPPVDSTGLLADGRRFENVEDLRKLLLADPDALSRNLIRQLLMYGAGTGERYSDRAAVDRILARAKEDGGGVRAILHAVVQSPLFRGGAP